MLDSGPYKTCLFILSCFSQISWSLSYRIRALLNLNMLCLTLRDPINYSPPVSSLHGIFQARILEWIAISFSRGSSWLRDWTRSPALQADSLPSEPPEKPYSEQSWIKDWFFFFSFCFCRLCWLLLFCLKDWNTFDKAIAFSSYKSVLRLYHVLHNTFLIPWYLAW